MKHHFPFYVLGLLMLFGVVLGRAVCGLLCPFGLVQDLLHQIPAPKLRVPKKIDRPARYLKYGILAVLVILLPAFLVTDTGMGQAASQAPQWTQRSLSSRIWKKLKRLNRA